MAALKELLPGPKSSSKTYYDHRNDPWFKQRFTATEEEEKSVAINPKLVPQYMKRSGWGKTHGLLMEGGLTYESIKQSVANANIAFREGVSELFEFLEEQDIPVLIFSAGLADIIEEVLRQKLKTFKNVKIVSNRMVFNDDGQLVSFKGHK